MNLKPESFYEIELKALLDKQMHQELDALLANDEKFKHFNTETIQTKFFKDHDKNDVRLRISDKTIELVYKKGLVKEYCRKEIKIPLANKEKYDYFLEIFRALPMRPERGTIKHKKEYIYNYKGHDYIVCLQHLEDFAYILEVEYLAQDPKEADLHVPNIREILTELDLDVIDGEKFMKQVSDYISGENTINN